MGAPDTVGTLPDFLVLFDGICNLCNGAVLFIIKRDKKDLYEHLLETEEYRETFYKGDLERITDASGFQVKLK